MEAEVTYKKASEIHREGILSIAEIIRKEFATNDDFLGYVAEWVSIRMCLVELYWIMVNEKHCQPIESLGEKEKLDLWNEAKRYNIEKTEKESVEKARKDLCKAIHGFGTYIQL